MYPNLGIDISEKEHSTNLYNKKVDVYWSRVISSPCSKINITNLIRDRECIFSEDTDIYQSTVNFALNEFEFRCHESWEKIINQIRNSKNRKKKVVLTTILGISAILGNIVDIGTTIYKFFSPKTNDLVHVQNDIIRLGTVVSALDRKINALGAEICAIEAFAQSNKYEYLYDKYDGNKVKITVMCK